MAWKNYTKEPLLYPRSIQKIKYITVQIIGSLRVNRCHHTESRAKYIANKLSVQLQQI